MSYFLIKQNKSQSIYATVSIRVSYVKFIVYNLKKKRHALENCAMSSEILFMPYAKTKAQIKRLCFCSLDSMIPVVAKSKMSRL